MVEERTRDAASSVCCREEPRQREVQLGIAIPRHSMALQQPDPLVAARDFITVPIAVSVPNADAAWARSWRQLGCVLLRAIAGNALGEADRHDAVIAAGSSVHDELHGKGFQIDDSAALTGLGDLKPCSIAPLFRPSQ